MNVLEGIDALKSGLMWVGLSALAAIAVGVICAWLCRGVASATRRLLTVARIIAFAVVSAFCVLRGGAKFLMPPPSTGGTPVVPVVITQEEIAQGWRLESVTTNEAVSYAMPTNRVEYMPWSLGGGDSQTNSVTFRCIEPLRKLVTTEQVGGRYVNPSRLVMGTNAVLKVGVNGPFTPSEVHWHVVSGSADVVPNGWSATVTPTGLGTVIVEARFNGDEIQPRFVLPVVQPRTIPVKAFIVDPPMNFAVDAWSDTEVSSRIQSANDIFSQVGLNLALLNCSHIQNKPEYWTLHHAEMATNSAGECFLALSRDAFQLFNTYTSNDCIELYFIGSVVGGGANALWNEFGIGVTRNATPRGFAHEILHAFGLSDCFSYNYQESNGQPVWLYASFYNEQVTRSTLTGQGDWGVETGRGFYEKSDTHGILFEKLLMFGYDAPDAADIPSGEILSLKEYPVSTNDTIRVPIGCEGMKKNEVEVFSK